MIELGGHYGTAFRFCPLEHAATSASTMDHVQKLASQFAEVSEKIFIFTNGLLEVVTIVDSTVQARQQFTAVKAEFPSLAILPIHKWAGVGAVG